MLKFMPDIVRISHKFSTVLKLTHVDSYYGKCTDDGGAVRSTWPRMGRC